MIVASYQGAGAVFVIVVLIVWLCWLADKLTGVQVENDHLRQRLGTRDDWPSDG